jgi:hypothetical protein
MSFSILHISDLHRDLADEVPNAWLLDSLSRDLQRLGEFDQVPAPSVCIVSGDLVYGVSPQTKDAEAELGRQYRQTEDFLADLADRHFAGRRDRIVIVPGNHDVSYPSVTRATTRVDVPVDDRAKAALVRELFSPHSTLRWSWRELCFYRIHDLSEYRRRFSAFAGMFKSFYKGRYVFKLEDPQQFNVFDFPDINLLLVGLNSCYNNDPIRRTAQFQPESLAAACRAVERPEYAGRLVGAVWHHNYRGGPQQSDYLDSSMLQLLIDVGVSLGFHGHQHMSECVTELTRLGPERRAMAIVSAGTLCAEPGNLPPGTPRSYNVVQIDPSASKGRVHQRVMTNESFALPVWGPGQFRTSGTSSLGFDISRPTKTRPPRLDLQLTLETGIELIGQRRYSDAIEALGPLSTDPLARRLLVQAIQQASDSSLVVRYLNPPSSDAEAIVVGGAILELEERDLANEFLELPQVASSDDASVREIVRQLRLRWRK